MVNDPNIPSSALNPRNSWTPEQDKLLIEHSAQRIAEAAVVLGLSIHAVYHRRQQLGLAKSRQAYRRWSSRDDAFLRKHSPHQSGTKIAARLGRHPDFVRRKRLELKLPKPSRSRDVTCDCGCGQLVHVPQHRQSSQHHFVNQQHMATFQRQRWVEKREAYPKDAPPGSVKREILQAVRSAIQTIGFRAMEQRTGITNATLRKCEKGNWKYLTLETLQKLKQVIPINLTDPKVTALVWSKAILEQNAKAMTVARVKEFEHHPRIRRRAFKDRKGRPNPKNSEIQRGRWEKIRANPGLYTEIITNRRSRLLPLRIRARLPTARIRQYIRRVARPMTDREALAYSARLSHACGVNREEVRWHVDRLRGVLGGGSRPPDIDLVWLIRMIRTAHPESTLKKVVREAQPILGRTLNIETVRRVLRYKKKGLPPLPPYPEHSDQLWSAEEIIELRARHARGESYRYIAIAMGRSAQAIGIRCHLLGIRRSG